MKIPLALSLSEIFIFFIFIVLIQVQATDNGTPPKSGVARVLLRVASLPSTSAHPPVISPLHPAQVMETDPPGHLVAFVTAEDPDNDTLWYSIVGELTIYFILFTFEFGFKLRCHNLL